MKKYFMFVAVAAAGMLASCSSDSLTAGSDPKIEPTQEERVPIQLSVASPSIDVARGETRGTGTVGGVGAGANVWEGQTINAFMFVKGSLTPALEDENDATSFFYKDLEMITPGTADNLITPAPDATKGEAMITDGTIKYYPANGNFDFFGYHGDDATGALDVSADPWVVPFTINGSQDLMSTKAAPLTWTELDATQKSKFGDSDTYDAFVTAGKFYSASAARKLIQPVLKFDHLLTRLSFVVKAGDDEAAGWNGTAQVPANAVTVNSIEVESKTTGDMAVAWIETPTNMINWGAATAYLPLKERPTYYVTLTPAITLSDAEYGALPFYYKTADPTVRISPAEWGALPVADPGTGADWQGNYTSLNVGQCTAIAATPANYNLTNLTPTYPTVTPAGGGSYTADETPIGEALIVAPSTTGYNMKVKISQLVPQNWTGTPAPAVKYQDYNLPIPAPAGGFLANTSYKVVLTVYGFKRIQVTTMITPWDEYGTAIEVGQDD
jgi:hypothetical protein